MNWLTNFVRPKIRALVEKRDVPEHLWQKCPSCGQMLHHREIREAMMVCPHCDHHLRMSARDRCALLFDGGTFEELPPPKVAADPLKFRDEKRYTDRLREARAKTTQEDAMIVAFGRMGGIEAVVAAQNFAFMGGSMGIAAGESLLLAAERAVEMKAPLIAITAAGGARMQEGILSLMQMPRTTIAVQMVQETGLPYVAILTDPTTGGVTASYAMLGDIALAEPGALIGFAGPRVIEQTIRERLPQGFQRSEYLLEHGMLDMVVHRHRMRDTLIGILDMLMNPTRSRIVAAPAAEEDVIEIPGPQDNGLDIPVPLPAPAPNDPAGERS
jgi:acetyl-CoA carboxylase carboxyl transferase subunit beta